jgi:multiple sugar transport system permease protein
VNLLSLRKSLNKKGSLKIQTWRYLTPAALIIGIVLGFPVLYSLYTALHHYILTDGKMGGFVGFENFSILLSDDRFWNAATNTINLSIIATLFPVIAGMIVALALNTKGLKFRNLYIAILLIPMFIPLIASGLIWLLILHPEQGILNYLLGVIGLPQLPWLGDPKYALWTVGLIDSWQQTSLMILLLFAGMNSIPTEPLEAAVVDGATSTQIFRFVILPLLKPTIVAAATIRFVGAFLTYDLVYILTQGGPGTATETISYYIARIAFRHLDMGYASAMSWVLMLIIILFVGFSLRLGKSEIS